MTSISTSITPSSSTSLADLAPMRALLQSRYGTAEVLRPGMAPRPRPRAKEVVVKVHAAGIDRGTWHLMSGRPYLMRLMGFGFFGPKSAVPGLDLAGTVVEVGAEVSRFRVGDRVFGMGEGAFAEYARASEEKLAIAPEGMPLDHAAVLGVSGTTALQALTDDGKLQAGERVLILGASGGVGTYAVQLAKALGAHVTGVCSSAKMELVRGLGADRVLDYRKDDFADGSAVYDLILDIGGNTPVSRLRRAMTETGRLIFVGNEQGGDWTAGFGRQIGAALLGLFVEQRFVSMMAREHHTLLERLLPFHQAGQLAPVIDRRVRLEEIGAALRDMEAGLVRGKMVVAIE